MTPFGHEALPVAVAVAGVGHGRSLRTSEQIGDRGRWLGGAADSPASGRLVIGVGDAPNPSGTVVSLRSHDPAVNVPAQVTVPAGQPGVAVPFQTSRRVESFAVTATWNGQSVTQTIYMPPA